MAEVVRVSVGRVVLAAVVRGVGLPGAPAVVFLPGAGATAATWDAVACGLVPRRTVAVDLRGHGASDRPGRYSVADMAADVAALIPRVAPGAVDLVGHSLGGLVALRVAAAAPELVRRLVLEDVGMPHPRTPHPPPRPSGDLAFDWRVVEQVRPEVDSPAADWGEVVATVTAPTLVVAGGPASFVSLAHVDELVAALPDGRSVVLGTGHDVHAERPAEFTAALASFLDAPATG
jgi:esterase